MGESLLPQPTSRSEPLLRGPLILTAVGRVLLIPFFFFCAVAATNDLHIFLGHHANYRGWYIAGKVGMAVSLWNFLLLHLLLAWLFFARRRIFRPLMVYASLLPFAYLVGITLYLSHFTNHGQTQGSSSARSEWIGGGATLVMVYWPFYYGFSPRVKRVFTR